METEDRIPAPDAKKSTLRVAWPFFFSKGLFARTFKRNWPKAHGDVTRGDIVSIFGADLEASNDIMIKHRALTTPPPKTGR